MLSRSAQSAAPILESESIQPSMLRNTRTRSRSRSRSRRETAGACHGHRQSSTNGMAIATCEPPGSGAGPDEETPLLQNTTTTTTNNNNNNKSGDVKVESDNPYLGGVSVTRFWLLFLQVNASYFIACFDSTIMASSHPVITSYFGSSNSASWLSTAFLLTSTSFQPVLGSFSDAVGRKDPYMLTTAVFLLATLWCALAQSMTSFIVARAFCGLGAGGIMTLGSIIVSDLVPIEIRGSFQSYINITYGLASMSGAALGGAMADYFGWRWEFGVQVPVILLCLIIAILVVPGDLGLDGKEKQTLREAMRTFDFKGSILLSSSVTFLILGLISAFLSNATIFNVPLYFQGVLLTSATTSGFRLVVSSAVASVAGTATGFLISYTRRLKWPLVLGTSLSVVGALCLTSMRRGWPGLLYVLCLLPGACGAGFQFPGTFMAVLAVSGPREQAAVTGALLLWRSLGQVLGIACSSLVVQNALWHYLDILVPPGPDKAHVVARARRSVEAIRDLPLQFREPVVRSYEAALRATFGCCAALAVVGLLLILPVRLPRLGKR